MLPIGISLPYEAYSTSIWKSPGGKSRSAKFIASIMAPHKVYAEGFFGGGAVFFAKPKSPKEVANDFDPEIASSLLFVRDYPPAAIPALVQMPWMDDKGYFAQVKAMKPRNELERFYRFIYLRKFSFGGKGQHYSIKAYTPELARGWISRKLPQFKQRLQGVEIRNADYRNIIKEFDSPETLFYFDPPYEEQRLKTLELSGNFDHQAFMKSCHGTQGKVVVSYDDTQSHRAGLHGFSIVILKVPSVMDQGRALGVVRNEILATSYPMNRQDVLAAAESFLFDVDKLKRPVLQNCT